MSEPAVRRSRPRPLSKWISGLLVAIVVAGCAGAGATPTPSPLPSPRATPTPVGARVTNPQEAAALVIPVNPLFAGAMPLDPELIGQSRWWASSPLAGGGYRIEVTVGWGDCPAGCINRHVWTYDVTPDGTPTLVEESGDEVPPTMPE